jgi:hypothetical protein
MNDQVVVVIGFWALTVLCFTAVAVVTGLAFRADAPDAAEAQRGVEAGTKPTRPSATPIGAAILASTAAALAILAGIVALAVDPPLLGWIGYGIVSAIVLGLAVLAMPAFERTRVSPQRPAVAPDREERLLVVADARCSETALRDEIVTRLDGAVAVHLVVPVRVSHLHFLTEDETEERRAAEQTVSTVVRLLRQRGVSTTGSVGSDKPLESMTDALGSFPATRVLLATPPEDETYWLERGLLAKARPLTAVPVSQAVIASAA